MRIILSVFFLFMSLDSFASEMTLQERRCSELLIRFRESAVDVPLQCKVIKGCLEKRRTCNQKLEDQTSCENFNTCMQGFYSADTSERSKCSYKWKFSFATGKRSCSLTRPQNWPHYNSSCPGYIGFEESDRPYSDIGFTCTGVKVKYNDLREKHIKLYYEYKEALDSGKCKGDRRILKIADKCEAAYETVD